MFKIGDKAKGFKFDGEEYPLIGWDDEMNDVVGVVGEVSYVGDGSYGVHFKDSGVDWGYPGDLWYLGKVEEEVIPSFTVGDRVKFKKSSIDSGMIDATEDDVFMVVHINSSREAQIQIWITGYPGWWNIDHFEHVKEGAMTNTDDAMNNTEEQEIKWEVGQEVWCLCFGKGVVKEVEENGPYTLTVGFRDDMGEVSYTKEGKLYKTAVSQTLFFSEPKIIAEKFPPKKPFVPVLKKGDKVVLQDSIDIGIFTVIGEDEDDIYYDADGVTTFTNKKLITVYKLGEEIIFN